MSQSDQIGLEEIKRRVGESLEKVLAEIESLPEGDRPATVRQIAKCVGCDLDADVALAVFREGLVRIVRRVLQKRNAAKNRAKQTKSKRPSSKKGK